MDLWISLLLLVATSRPNRLYRRPPLEIDRHLLDYQRLVVNKEKEVREEKQDRNKTAEPAAPFP